MHFGKVVKSVALSQGFTAYELGLLVARPEKEILEMYEEEEWTSGNIKAASMALDYNFGKYFDNAFSFNFLSSSDQADTREYLINVRYPKGKEQLLKVWLQNIGKIAQAIGLEIRKL